jgi:hypothetical protein
MLLPDYRYYLYLVLSDMKIFLCELGDRSRDHYIKGQLRAKKSVNSGVQLRTELCALVYLFTFGLFYNAFNFSSSIMFWHLFGAMAFITFSSSLLSSLLLPSRYFQFLILYSVKCMDAQIFQKCRSHLKFLGT